VLFHQIVLLKIGFNTIEPVTATFPMTDEGRAMMSEKIISELNIFLAKNSIEGQVKEVKIIHILAH
jgi:hypothetical protein